MAALLGEHLRLLTGDNSDACDDGSLAPPRPDGQLRISSRALGHNRAPFCGQARWTARLLAVGLLAVALAMVALAGGTRGLARWSPSELLGRAATRAPDRGATKPTPSSAPRQAALPPPEAKPVGPEPVTFYVYRAQSANTYPLENLNAADLAGVMWYLHNEVVVSTPRKYSIDRIRRFKVTMRNTQEFWNVHHRLFGPFLAFDAGRCTTPMCGNLFQQYGFVVGCQVLSPKVAAYLSSSMTQVNGACVGPLCNAPVWYALPGPCPVEGLTNEQIANNKGAQDVMRAKSPQCLSDQPGGRCDGADGGPDCTYSVEPAGEVLLDELTGIADYNRFWNGSYVECAAAVAKGTGKGPCTRQMEYDLRKDAGVGCSFWDGKQDFAKAAKRMDAVRALFKRHYPNQASKLDEPPCDFDMYYDGEFSWPTNHSNTVPPSRGFSWEKMRMSKTTAAPSTTMEVSEWEFVPKDAHGGCKDAAPGEECHTTVDWAMQHGIYEHPEWYTGLTSKANFREFQANFYETGRGGCQRPCGGEGGHPQQQPAKVDTHGRAHPLAGKSAVQGEKKHWQETADMEFRMKEK